MTRVSALWRLQTIDLERDEKTARSGQIEQLLAGDPQLVAARSAHDAEQKRLGDLRATLTSRELEAQTLDAKIKVIESRLSSGRVTNPKELDSLEKDRQQHLRQRSDLDGQLLELMDAIERAQKSVNETNAALRKTETTRAGDEEKLTRERESLATRFAELDRLRDTARLAIDAAALTTYDRLRPAKGSRALALLKNDACNACGVLIPSALLSRIDEAEDLVFCTSCGRILAS
jgi:predicted  nucleic acid-binding Zn-ribbon protein